MLPLDKASAVSYHYTRQGNPADPSHRSPPSSVYTASINPFWTVGSVAHGGYMLSVLTSAVKTHQTRVSSPHIDPAHLTSQFFSATVPGKAEVEVKEVSVTKRWTRLDVELWQHTPDPDAKDLTDPKLQRVLRIQAHYLVTSLSPHPSRGEAAPAGQLDYLERPCPLLEHPGAVDMSDGGSHVPAKLSFRDGMRWKEVELVKPNDGSLVWGAWIELRSGEDLRDAVALIPFFGDVAANAPQMLPEEERPGPSWFPTMTFSLDFKSAFPLPSSSAKRTFGLYSTSKSIIAGRHDLTVEVWSAPADLGEGVQGGEAREKGEDGVERWRREGSRLVGVSTQMALSVPLEVNHARGRQTPTGDSEAAVDKKKARL
ncbi:hypothetical protein JCM10213_009115 [Rhodosporidiobolus nylandii]